MRNWPRNLAGLWQKVLNGAGVTNRATVGAALELFSCSSFLCFSFFSLCFRCYNFVSVFRSVTTNIQKTASQKNSMGELEVWGSEGGAVSPTTLSATKYPKMMAITILRPWR